MFKSGGITTNPVSIRSLNDADDTVLAKFLKLVKEAKAFVKLSTSPRAKVLAAWNDLVASVVHKDWTSVKEAALTFLQANGVKYTKSNIESANKKENQIIEFSFIFRFRQSTSDTKRSA